MSFRVANRLSMLHWNSLEREINSTLREVEGFVVMDDLLCKRLQLASRKYFAEIVFDRFFRRSLWLSRYGRWLEHRVLSLSVVPWLSWLIDAARIDTIDACQTWVEVTDCLSLSTRSINSMVN